MVDILELNEITSEIINYYKSNIEEAKKDYQKLIDSCIVDESMITEVHHILPRCLGGNDEEKNLVRLNYRDHVKAHMLLYTIYPDSGLSIAFELLINTRLSSTNIIVNLDVLDELKKLSHTRLSEFASQRTGEKNSFFGKHHSEETKKKISEIRKQNYTKEKHPRYGVTLTNETRAKISAHHADFSGSNNPAAKRLIGPDGYECGSIKEAMVRYGESRQTISRNIQGKYKFLT